MSALQTTTRQHIPRVPVIIHMDDRDAVPAAALNPSRDTSSTQAPTEDAPAVTGRGSSCRQCVLEGGFALDGTTAKTERAGEWSEAGFRSAKEARLCQNSSWTLRTVWLR